MKVRARNVKHMTRSAPHRQRIPGDVSHPANAGPACWPCRQVFDKSQERRYPAAVKWMAICNGWYSHRYMFGLFWVPPRTARPAARSVVTARYVTAASAAEAGMPADIMHFHGLLLAV